MTAANPAGVPASRPMRQVIGRFFDRWSLVVYTILAVIYLLVPVAVIILFSFNDPAGKSNVVWQGFTVKYWLDPFGPSGLGGAVILSLTIAFLSTAIATALGTLIALALERYSFRGKGFASALIFLPMATPEIILGASLLTMFVAIGNPPFFPLNFLTILIAHVMFNISYVVVTVRARLAGFPRHLEEAAADLYANEWNTFWRVTFPLILPGIVAAALLAFSLSIDDFVITNFVSGTSNTFPIWTWSIIKNALPPQINVVGSIIFLSAVAIVLITTLRTGRAPR